MSELERIVIGGISGSGKSTLACAVAARLRVPYVELDALFHGPGWTPREDFVADSRRLLAPDGRWVTDSFGYPEIRDELWAKADTLVWLDYPRRVVIPRVVRRSVTRWALRQELWNGNRERARDWRQPWHPVRWAWSWYADGRRADMLTRWADPTWPGERLRFSGPVDTQAWLDSLSPGGG